MCVILEYGYIYISHPHYNMIIKYFYNYSTHVSDSIAKYHKNCSSSTLLPLRYNQMALLVPSVRSHLVPIPSLPFHFIFQTCCGIASSPLLELFVSRPIIVAVIPVILPADEVDDVVAECLASRSA